MKIREIENNDSLNMWGYSKLSPNFRFKEKINKKVDCTFGICNSFDTFLSPIDNQPYLLFSNRVDTCINIYIYSIIKKEILKKLAPTVHSKELRLLKYFLNKAKTREHIISADCDGNICIWSAPNAYFILQKKIHAYNQNDIYSCILLFKDEVNYKIEDDYLIFACEVVADDETTSAKVYSLNKGNFIRNIFATNNEKIRYLLMWNNKKNKETYLICLGMDKIMIINFLKNRKEKEIITKEKNTYNCGIIYNEKIEGENNEKSFLVCTSSMGRILVFDLEEGNKTCEIFCKPNIHRIYDILPWNEKYFIVADTYDNGYRILGFQKGGLIYTISNVAGIDEDDIECLRKINHPVYGECLVTGSHKNIIKILACVTYNF